MIYLADVGDHALGAALVGPWREAVELRPGLLLIDSDQTRSTVYHALKAELPAGSALLVTELHEVPKFKGMAPGTLAWLRARLPASHPGGGRP
jgi:hypothetical protein